LVLGGFSKLTVSQQILFARQMNSGLSHAVNLALLARSRNNGEPSNATIDGSVTVHFSDGSTYIGGILIGADGPKSKIRELLVGVEKSRNTPVYQE